MLTFQLVTKKEEIEQMFPGFGEGVVYLAYNREKALGCCLFRVTGERVEIRILNTANSDESTVTEGLLRAALGYGSRRGAFRAVLIEKIPDFKPESLGFRKVEGRYEAEIYDVLSSGRCACCACLDVATD